METVAVNYLVKVGIFLAGALIRSHASKLWPWVAPVFGAPAKPAADAPPAKG